MSCRPMGRDLDDKVTGIVTAGTPAKITFGPCYTKRPKKIMSGQFKR